MIVSYCGPSVANRRRNKKLAAQCRQAKYGGKKHCRRNGRKPRKPQRINKYMRHVLSYINDDTDDVVYDREKKQPTFDIFLGRTLCKNVLLLDYAIEGITDVVKQFYIDVVKPNMVETKFTNLNPEQLFGWVQLAKKFTIKGEGCENLEVVRDTLAEWSKKDLKIIHQCFELYPELSKWVKEHDSSRELEFGAKSLISVAKARKFAALVQKLGRDGLSNRLLQLNDAFCFDEDTEWMERLDHIYHEANESRWRARTCVQCSAECWDSEAHCFSRMYDRCDCGMSTQRRCATCILNIVQRKHEKGEDTPFGCSKGKCILLLHTLKGDATSVFAKHLGVNAAEVEKLQAADFEKIVISVLREMPAKVMAEPNKEHQWSQNRRALRNLNYDSVKGLAPEVKQECETLFTKIDNILKMHRTKKEFPALDRGIDGVMSNMFEEPEKMFSSCKTLVGPIQRILNNRPTGMNKIPEMFDMSAETIVNLKLQRAKDVLSVAYGQAKQCAICMSVVKPTDKDEILQLHNEFDNDVSQWHYDKNKYRNGRKQFRLPCFACKDCFSNYLNYKKALGKPAMKCPGMGCGCALRKTHIKKICPQAYEDHEIAMKRFALKRVKNFRTCPNADCAASIVIDIDCNVAKVTCASCNFEFCPNCNDSPHEGISCEEMRRRRHAERWGDSKDYMENETKQCPFCLTWIEKNGGCNHMTCHHCRGEFCWLCFGNWSTHTSCTKMEPVVRRPFNMLFPDWIEKPKKTLKPRFHPGKYVTFKDASQDLIGRVQSVKELGLYAIEPVHDSFHGVKVIEESLLRGHNKFVFHKDDLANDEEAYTRFLSGFSDEEQDVENPDVVDSGDDSSVELNVDSAGANVSVELTLKDICPVDAFLTRVPSEDELEDDYFAHASFLSGFSDSDSEDGLDEGKQKLLAKFANISMHGRTGHIWNENKKLQTLKELNRLRASREKEREKMLDELPRGFFYSTDDSDTCELPRGFFYFSEDSDSSS